LTRSAIDVYVTAATKLFPHAMLHWEDFGAGNARRILEKYANRCTFNDDLQGTAATALAAVYTAMRVTRSQLCDQRVVIHGAGTAGLGIADMMRDVMVSEGLTPDEATGRFYAVDREGLLGASRTGPRYDFQARYARSPDELAGWPRGRHGEIGLAEVVEKVAPTILIGTSTQAERRHDLGGREGDRVTVRPHYPRRGAAAAGGQPEAGLGDDRGRRGSGGRRGGTRRAPAHRSHPAGARGDVAPRIPRLRRHLRMPRGRG
jgi:hypothetical protein